MYYNSIIIANIPNKSTFKKRVVSTKIDEACFEIAICFKCLLEAGFPPFFFFCGNRGIMVFTCYLAICICYCVCVFMCVWYCGAAYMNTHTHTSTHTTQTLKGIRNISMCDELPQITSPQHFHDIVAVLPHYHNVTAAV